MKQFVADSLLQGKMVEDPSGTIIPSAEGQQAEKFEPEPAVRSGLHPLQEESVQDWDRNLEWASQVIDQLQNPEISRTEKLRAIGIAVDESVDLYWLSRGELADIVRYLYAVLPDIQRQERRNPS